MVGGWVWSISLDYANQYGHYCSQATSVWLRNKSVLFLKCLFYSIDSWFPWSSFCITCLSIKRSLTFLKKAYNLSWLDIKTYVSGTFSSLGHIRDQVLMATAQTQPLLPPHHPCSCCQRAPAEDERVSKQPKQVATLVSTKREQPQLSSSKPYGHTQLYGRPEPDLRKLSDKVIAAVPSGLRGPTYCLFGDKRYSCGSKCELLARAQCCGSIVIVIHK